MYEQNAPNPLSMFKYPTLRKNLIICCSSLFINYFIWYGSIFGLEAISSRHIYFNSIV